MGLFTAGTMKDLEEELVFPSFSRADAAALGALVDEESRKIGFPVAVEVVINHLVVFRYFQDGCAPASHNWLQKKRSVVELQNMSSLRFGLMLAESGQTMEDNKMNPEDFAPAGGGMPIAIRGTGVIGSVCVSGCPNDEDDQIIVTNAMRRLLQMKTS